MNGTSQGSAYGPPIADADRLAALERYGILDTPAEQDFDDIVLIATQLCAAPIALVSLVAADRQWFKARIGVEVPGTPIEQSVCVHALTRASGDLLVIPDLRRDARTGANPLVTGPEALRFYAGAPLVTQDGWVLGTLCVLDVTPRPEGLTPLQRTGLAALARQVMAQLELRRAVAAREAGLARQYREGETLRSDAAALVESEMRLRLAVEATGVGIFDYDPVGGKLVWDARTRALFGIGPEEPVSYEGTFLPGVHPEDRERADRAARQALDPDGPGRFADEYRTVDREGRVLHWLDARGQLTVADGRATRFVGTVRDVTAERNAQAAMRATEERYRLVTRATNDAIWDWDLVTGHFQWNEALGTAYGWEPDRVEPTGGWWFAHVHPDDRDRVESEIRRVIDGAEQDWRHEYRFARADGRYAEVLDRGYMVRAPNGAPLRMIGAMLDLTERNRAEAQLGAVFEGANVGIVQIDPRSLKVLRVNAKLCAIWGASEADIVGQSVAKWTPDEDVEERDRLHRRLAAGEILRETLEKRYRRKDGRVIWARVNVVSQWHGEEILTTAMIEDITAEKAAEARHKALVELGDRLRDAETTADVSAATAEILGRTLGAARAGYATIDLRAGTLTVERDWTRGDVEGHVGTYPLSSFAGTIAHLKRGAVLAIPDVSAAAFPGEDAATYARIRTRAAIILPLMRRGALVGVLYAHEPEPRDWSRGEIEFASEIAERSWAALGRLHASEQQRLLNRELSHRLKNTLSMVQAIAAQTLRNVANVEAKETLVARLVALGKAHDILLEGESESAEIEAVIAGALAIHDDGEPGRFRLSGPSIHVAPQAALALALMIHELATNAAKYGALSVPGGRVRIDWAIDGTAGEPTVRMCWREQGGPAVAAPSRQGFGSRLIERGLSGAVGGETVVEYALDGVVCRVVAPLSGFLARE